MATDFKKFFLINVGVAAAAAVVFLSLTYWLGYDISKKADAVQKTRKEISLRFKALEALASLKKDEKIAGTKRLIIEAKLPIQDALINFPKDIAGLAKKSNVDLGFSFGKETVGDESKPGFISFTMTAKASFNDWLKFVEAVEESRYFVSFDSFNLAGTENSFQSVINGRVFSQ